MLTGADENFVTGQRISAVRLRLGAGAQKTQVGAAVGLGQAHGAGPFAAGELGQVQRFLRIIAVRMQGLVSAVRQARVHGPGLVGRIEHFIQAQIQRKRQSLAAVDRVCRQRGPTAFDVFGVSLFETFGRAHFMRGFVQRATFGVTADVQRKSHLGGELAGLFQHGVDGVGINIGMLRQMLVVIGDFEHFVQDKLHVAQGRCVLSHENLPEKTIGSQTKKCLSACGWPDCRSAPECLQTPARRAP